MRKAIALAGITGAIISGGITFAATAFARPTPSGADRPPECVHTTISDDSGSGPKLWVVWCGTGSSGDSPMTDGSKSLVVNGGWLNPSSCTRIAPCYVMWPASPPEAASGDAGG
jgi:hypothetical protein